MKKLITIVALVALAIGSSFAEPPAQLLKWFNENHPEVAAVYMNEFNNYRRLNAEYKKAEEALRDERDAYADSLYEPLNKKIEKTLKKKLSKERFSELAAIHKSNVNYTWFAIICSDKNLDELSYSEIILLRDEIRVETDKITQKTNKKYLPKFDALEKANCPELPFRWATIKNYNEKEFAAKLVWIGNVQLAIEEDWVKE